MRSYCNVAPLHGLPLLQRLVVKESIHLAAQLLQPGAFTSLQQLHVEADYPADECGYPFMDSLQRPMGSYISSPLGGLHAFHEYAWEMDEAEELEVMRVLVKRKAIECMSAVLELPHIRRISGNATLLNLGLPHMPPHGWVVSQDEQASRIFTKI